MRAAALLLLLAAGCSAQPPRGGGIVSTNPCADAMLVELVPAERIAAISHYSRDPTATSIPLDIAARFRTTTGTAEEVVMMRPDLVIGSAFTPAATRSAYARAGLRTIYLDSPATIEASKVQIGELAEAIGVPEAGRAMNARIDRAVAAGTWQGTERIPGLIWIAGSLVSGGGNLLDEMMVRAGFTNQAAHYGLQHTGYLPTETVAADPPRVMLVPNEPGRAASSRAAELRSRVLSHMGARVTEAQLSPDLVNCGGPVIGRAMTRLAEIRRSTTSQ